MTVRPVLVREIRAASVSTSRCFMIAGSDMGNGRARSLMDSAFPLAQLGDQRAPRRIGERRENVIQIGVLILNHIVNNTTRAKPCKASREAARRAPTDGIASASGAGRSGRMGKCSGLH